MRRTESETKLAPLSQVPDGDHASRLILAYVIYGDLNRLAGDQIHAREVAKAWVKQGHSVVLVVPRFGVPHGLPGPAVIGVPTVTRGAVGSLVFAALVPLYLAVAHLQRKLDVVYTLEASFVATPLLFCWFAGLPHVMEVHGITLNEIPMRRPDPLKHHLVWCVEWLNFRSSRLSIAVSDGIGRFIGRMFGVAEERLFAVPNGVDVDTYRPRNPQVSRKELGLPSGARVVGFVGAFYTYQRAERVVRIAPRVIQTCPEAFFVMVGEGPRLEEVKREAIEGGVGDRFLFTGGLPAPLCARAVDAFDVGVGFHDEQQDGSPMKLLNYLACGKPVVTTRSSGTFYIEREQLGLLVDQDDEVGAAAAVATVLNDPAYCGSFASRARAEVVRHHSWEAAARRIAAILARVV